MFEIIAVLLHSNKQPSIYSTYNKAHNFCYVKALLYHFCKLYTMVNG